MGSDDVADSNAANLQAVKLFSYVPFLSLFRNLIPVTQLYVSVDASTKDSLKKIDRPLFRDFWPRFLDSLKALSEKVWVLHVLVKWVCIRGSKLSDWMEVVVCCDISPSNLSKGLAPTYVRQVGRLFVAGRATSNLRFT